MDRTIYVCTQCNGPRSRRSKGLCLDCYSSGRHPECAHHIVFADQRGPTSLGVCKFCGERRSGSNYIHDFGPIIPSDPDVVASSGDERIKSARRRYNRMVYRRV
jgi:hypothetical protein